MFVLRKALYVGCVLCLLLRAAASALFGQTTEYAYVTSSGVTGNAVSGFNVDAPAGALTPCGSRGRGFTPEPSGRVQFTELPHHKQLTGDKD